MIVVRLMGGLGNQMFEYAYARHLSIIHNTELYLDCSFINSSIKDVIKRNNDLLIFNTKYKDGTNYLSEKYHYKKRDLVQSYLFRIRRFMNGDYMLQKHAHEFDKKYLQAGDSVYLDGYWASFKFFDAIRDIILDDFSLRAELPLHVSELKDEINSANSVCVNIRRADFVNSDFHLSIPVDYYLRAKKEIDSRLDNPRYYIFSDDIAWCKENITFFENSQFVDHSFAGKQFEFYLELMRQCKNFIIPNSSFAWWAAWLNTNPGKLVIAPDKWYVNYTFNLDDLIPENWITIASETR